MVHVHQGRHMLLGPWLLMFAMLDRPRDVGESQGADSWPQ